MTAFDPVWGDLRLQQDMFDAEVKANLVISRSRYLMRHWGRSTLEEVANRVDGMARDWLLNPPSAFLWLPVRPLMEIDKAIVDGPMHGDVAKMRPFGAEIALYDLSTVYKLLIRMTMSPSRMIKKAPDIWREYFRAGRIVVDRVEDYSCRMQLTGYVAPLYQCNYGIAGWIQTAMELSGGKSVGVTPKQCCHRGDKVCDFLVSWR